MRGFLLAFMATFSGCLLFYTLPDAIAASMGRVMPAAFYEGQARPLTPPHQPPPWALLRTRVHFFS